MALVFFDNPEAPIECAMQISTAIKSHPDIGLRMGVHSGPVNRTVDVNQRLNMTGAGIDVAQRVMDCGDAGHILLSRRAADDLAPLPRWNPHLHDLGECDVKHGRKMSLVNFYTAEVGNPARRTSARPPRPEIDLCPIEAPFGKNLRSFAGQRCSSSRLVWRLLFSLARSSCRGGQTRAGNHSIHCGSAFRKREQRSQHRVFVGRNFRGADR